MMVTSAEAGVTDVCVRRGNEGGIEGCVPRRGSSGVTTGSLVQCKAPVTINLAAPLDGTAEQVAAQPCKRSTKGQCSQTAIRSAAAVFVGALSLAAITVLCMHFLGHGQAAEDWSTADSMRAADGNITLTSSNQANNWSLPANETAGRDDTASCGQHDHIYLCGNISGGSCPRHYSPAEWGAKPPYKLVPMIHPIKYVVVSHTAMSRCGDLASCGKVARSMQAYHLSLKYDDVAYNFMVSDDGSVYEGRGWGRSSSHLKRRGNISLGVTFMGDYRVGRLTERQVRSTLMLLEHGVRCGYLAGDYQLVAHNQTRVTESPGQYAFQVIANWQHYSDAILF